MLKLNKNFKPRWVLVNTVSALAGGVTWFALYTAYRYHISGPFAVNDETVPAVWLVPIIAVAVTGIVLGLTSYLVLRAYTPNISWWRWVLSNTAGLVGGLLTVGLVSLPCRIDPIVMNFSALGTLLGTSWSSESMIGPAFLASIYGSMFAAPFAATVGVGLGIAQAVMLRRYIPDTVAWPICTAFALGCAGATGGVFFWFAASIIFTFIGKPTDPTFLSIFAWATIGAVYGVISGGGLRSLFEDEPYKYPERVKSQSQGPVE